MFMKSPKILTMFMKSPKILTMLSNLKIVRILMMWDSKRYSIYSDNDKDSWKEALSGSCCKQWFITMERPALGSTSMQKMEYYNKALTSVVGR
ncbi:hypothetical protein FRX31_012913 [Thalictrum thalictroides]|uniref:Uncharacterized protein n=1 Tax=Thalictrum thalictroides TaxID=46969 RepID=A0A7J6WLN8_THATH|nr:hypothetical protein FRX31_012913 [Thalictrum thalictroides]